MGEGEEGTGMIEAEEIPTLGISLMEYPFAEVRQRQQGAGPER